MASAHRYIVDEVIIDFNVGKWAEEYLIKALDVLGVPHKALTVEEYDDGCTCLFKKSRDIWAAARAECPVHSEGKTREEWQAYLDNNYEWPRA